MNARTRTGKRRAIARIAGRVSYANVAATLALVVALGTGGAYAASQIGPKDIKKNAVRAKHIKKNQVKAKHVGKNVVKSKHIKNGQVKAADLADPEASHRVDAQGEPAFGNGGQSDCLWLNGEVVIPDVNPASFFKDADGIVHLAGVPRAIDGGGGDGICNTPAGDPSDTVIFRLPAGYRPRHLEVFPSGSSTIGLNFVAPVGGVTVDGEFVSGGSVFVSTVSDESVTTLDGFTFRAAGPAAGPLGSKQPAEISLKAVRALLQ